MFTQLVTETQLERVQCLSHTSDEVLIRSFLKGTGELPHPGDPKLSPRRAHPQFVAGGQCFSRHQYKSPFLYRSRLAPFFDISPRKTKSLTDIFPLHELHLCPSNEFLLNQIIPSYTKMLLFYKTMQYGYVGIYFNLHC